MSIKIAFVMAAGLCIAGMASGEETQVAASGTTQIAAVSGAAAVPAVSSPPPPSSTWQFGFRAGWGKDFFDGSTNNVSVLGDPALGQRVQGSRAWHYGQNMVDLAVDVQTPEYWSNIALFSTIGGGLSVGSTGKEGARVGRDGMGSVVAASIEDNGMFYMHFGPSFRIDLPCGNGQSFELRPYTGFSLHSFTGKLAVDELTRMDIIPPPFDGDGTPPPAKTVTQRSHRETQSSQTRVSPLLGIETVFHLDCPIFSACQPHPYGLDAYLAYDYSFNTNGHDSIQGTTAHGVQYRGEYNPGGVNRIAAGFQFHFNAPWE